MDTATSRAQRRTPICGAIAAVFQLVSLSFGLVPPFRHFAADAAQQPGEGSIPFVVLDSIPLAALCLAVAALLRHERFRWLSWAILFSYGLPILLALVVTIYAAFRH